MNQSFNKVRIENKEIGSTCPVYIVFEAGPTHDGFETATKLVDVAVEAGADAIKFQILDAEKMVSGPDVMFTYKRLVSRNTGKVEVVTEPLLDILKRRELKRDEWKRLIAYCRKKKITFFSTISNTEEMHFLLENKVDTVKICSGDVNFFYLLKQVAGYDWTVQIDTGSSSLGEVEEAVNVLESSGCNKIIINHCPSGYPARLEGINLKVIQTLHHLFPYPIAFSDHSIGHEMDIAAVTLGANMLEKTITLDRTIRSPEHIMSLESHEAKSFINVVRDLEIALGNSRRIMTAEEMKARLIVKRSLFAGADIRKGEVLTQDKLYYSRPGDGIPAHMDTFVLGRKASRDVSGGEKLNFADFF